MKLQTKNSKKVSVKFLRFDIVGEKVYAVYIDTKGKEYKYRMPVLLKKNK